jgi:outer membrane protein OmpA-like peptidoglycan-associated protein
VLFESGKADLKPASFVYLDELAGILLKNNQLKIEIGGHTDDVGDEISNQVLSEKRAQAVFTYLKDKQVPAIQVSCRGYGESVPVAANDAETGRQQNRRVTCKVLD